MFHIERMAHPILPPVIRILLSPSFLAIPLVSPVVRIACHLLSLPQPLPDPLAFLSVTVLLVFYTRIREKKLPAAGIGTSDHIVHGLPPPETINLFSLLPQCQSLMRGQKW